MIHPLPKVVEEPQQLMHGYLGVFILEAAGSLKLLSHMGRREGNGSRSMYREGETEKPLKPCQRTNQFKRDWRMTDLFFIFSTTKKKLKFHRLILENFQ